MVFYILEALMNKYQLKEYLIENMPKLKLALYQLERLIQNHLPTIHKLLHKNSIACEFFAVQWFITLFSCDFTPPYLYIAWDIFLLRGNKFLFQFALSTLSQLNKYITLHDYESIITYLKNSIKENHILQSRVLSEALKYKVTKKELAIYQMEYETSSKETVREHISALPSPPREEKTAERPLTLIANTKIHQSKPNSRNIKDLHKSCSKVMTKNVLLKENRPVKIKFISSDKKLANECSKRTVCKLKKGLFKKSCGLEI